MLALIVQGTTRIKTEQEREKQQILFTSTLDWLKGTLGELKLDPLLAEEEEDLLEKLKGRAGTGVLVVAEDAPLLTAAQIKEGYDFYKKTGEEITLFSSDDQLVTGAGWYSTAVLLKVLDGLASPFTLYQLHQKLKEHALNISRYWVESWALLSADNSVTRARLSKAASELTIKKHLYNNVEIPLSDGIIISPQVTIGENTTILPGTILKGKTVIGRGCTIGPNTQLDTVQVGDGAFVGTSMATQSTIGEGAKVGPNSHLRPHSHIGQGAKIGAYVEIKNSTIGEKTSIAHLTYVGDSEIGKECNLGCGVVTVNYDGKNKNKIILKDRVFVGCNCNLIAPVTMEEGSYAAAGTTITQNVPAGQLAIGRSRQENKEHWIHPKNK